MCHAVWTDFGFSQLSGTDAASHSVRFWAGAVRKADPRDFLHQMACHDLELLIPR